MRVLSVGNAYPPHHLGGYEVIQRGVVEELRARGHESRVLTTDYRNPDLPADTSEDPDVHRELRWYWRDHAWPKLAARERLELERHNARVFDRHLAELRPDVVAWWALGGMSLSLVERARRTGVPTVFFVLDYWPYYGFEHDQWLAMFAPRSRRAAALAAQRATGIPTSVRLEESGRWLFCSESLRSQVVGPGHALPHAEHGILAPGIERRFLQEPREPAPEWRWRLLYLGRVVEQKGVATAVEALARLPAEATLRIVGPGDAPYRRELEARAAALGVSERVTFAPPVGREQTVAAYRDADALLFPVVWDEPFGLVPLEAMALGVPVVATGRGGSGDFLANGVNSLLFEARDADALAAAVSRLAADPELRERLRSGGYETAAAHGEDGFNRAAVLELTAAARRGGRSS